MDRWLIGVRCRAVRSVLLFALCGSLAGEIQAHPGDGLAVDSKGGIYFTDVSRKALWKIDQSEQLSKVLENHWTHGFHIDQHDRIWVEVEVDNTRYSMLRIEPDGSHKTILPPVERGLEFYGVNLLADLDGTVYFPHSNPPKHFATGIRKRTTNGDTSLLAGSSVYGTRDGIGDDAQFMGINSMCFGPDGMIYVVDQDSVRKIDLSGRVETLFEGLKLSNPENQPFDNGNPSVSNRLYGITVSDDGCIYVAYHGDRCVLKLSDRGREEVYRSTPPWSPVGVVSRGSELIIKETGLEPGSEQPGPRISLLKPSGVVETLIVVQ